MKLHENTFRAVNIALAFELAEACETHGLDPIEVIEGAATKPYGFMPHYPSAGVGGHCIAVDPHYLLHDLRERGRPAKMAEEALRKLAGRPRHVAWRAHEVLVELGRPLPEARVLVVGISYKPGVADTRESPALEIVARLRAEGAHVDYHDPLVPALEVSGGRLTGMAAPAAAGLESAAAAGGVGLDRRSGRGSVLDPEQYDLAILTTLHPDHDYEWLGRCPAVLDCTYRRRDAGLMRFTP